MKKNDTPINKNKSDYLKEIVFSSPLLPQSEIDRHFDMLDHMIFQCIERLLINSKIVQHCLTNLIAEIAAGSTHGKIIYNRTPDKTDDYLFNKEDRKFLQKAINIVELFHTSEDPTMIVRVLRKLGFSRGVFEQICQDFLAICKGYDEFVDDYSIQYIKTGNKQKIDACVQKYSELLCVMIEIENAVGIERNILYGLYRTLRTTFNTYNKIREKISIPYLRIVYTMAKTYSKNEQQFYDNFQNGSLGLMRAVGCYDPERNANFSSYSKWWVKSTLLLGMKEDFNFIRLPISVWQNFTKIEKIKNSLRAGKSQAAIDKRVTRKTGLSQEKINKINDYVKLNQLTSLEYKLDGESSAPSLGELIRDSSIDEQQRNQESAKLVEELFVGLTPDERLVASLTFGLWELIPAKAAIKDPDKIKEIVRQELARRKISKKKK